MELFIPSTQNKFKISSLCVNRYCGKWRLGAMWCVLHGADGSLRDPCLRFSFWLASITNVTLTVNAPDSSLTKKRLEMITGFSSTAVSSITAAGARLRPPANHTPVPFEHFSKGFVLNIVSGTWSKCRKCGCVQAVRNFPCQICQHLYANVNLHKAVTHSSTHVKF